MVIDFKVNFNNYEEKILKNYSFFDYPCPKCGAKHSLTRHGSYDRNVCFIDAAQNIVEQKFTLLRVKCSSCNSTHAILPNDIIPYCIYSFSFILSTLTEYYSNEHSIPDLSSIFSISFQLIYIFIAKFSSFLNSCSIVLRSLGYVIPPNPDTVVSVLNSYQLSGNFLYQYFFACQWMLLMTKFQNIVPRSIYISGFY